jgi:hypothetical protein
VIADLPLAHPNDTPTVAGFERYFGRPAAAHRLGREIILIYRRNLLRQLAPTLPLKAS